jgi:coniferyl-aldehyde dehydrogenase
MLQPSEPRPNELLAAYDRLRAVWKRDGQLDLAARRKTLLALRSSLIDRAEAFADALNVDFRGRSRHESLLTEVAVPVSAIDYTLPRMPKWARPNRVALEWPNWLASARLFKSARGVAGIIGPSNYPLQLALMPLIGSLSAGCRTIVKPSEKTPRTAALLQSIFAECIDSDIVSVVCGGPAIAAALAELPLDVLLFTGSRRVGEIIASAAARRLTPVILELGGKSPVVVDRSADLKRTALSIMRGKLLNAGQTCVAPDYVLVPRESFDALVASLKEAAAALYPSPASGDYSAVLSPAALDRLKRLQAGHTVVDLFAEPLVAPYYGPKLVLSPPVDSELMQEEIFGPLLPVIAYQDIEEALSIVNGLPSALAIYWFGKPNERLKKILQSTSSGTVSVNETVIHAGISALPLGGVGGSGMGRYHGRAGFDAFTLDRAVFQQSRFSVTNLMRPPYGTMADRILKYLLR